MCRNIKRLRQPDRPASDEEVREAALQYVRKVSGYHKPSKANRAAFEAAVEQIAGMTRDLLLDLKSAERDTPAGR